MDTIEFISLRNDSRVKLIHSRVKLMSAFIYYTMGRCFNVNLFCQAALLHLLLIRHGYLNTCIIVVLMPFLIQSPVEGQREDLFTYRAEVRPLHPLYQQWGEETIQTCSSLDRSCS